MFPNIQIAAFTIQKKITDKVFVIKASQLISSSNIPTLKLIPAIDQINVRYEDLITNYQAGKLEVSSADSTYTTTPFPQGIVLFLDNDIKQLENPIVKALILERFQLQRDLTYGKPWTERSTSEKCFDLGNILALVGNPNTVQEIAETYETLLEIAITKKTKASIKQEVENWLAKNPNITPEKLLQKLAIPDDVIKNILNSASTGIIGYREGQAAPGLDIKWDLPKAIKLMPAINDKHILLLDLNAVPSNILEISTEHFLIFENPANVSRFNKQLLTFSSLDSALVGLAEEELANLNCLADAKTSFINVIKNIQPTTTETVNHAVTLVSDQKSLLSKRLYVFSLNAPGINLTIPETTDNINKQLKTSDSIPQLNKALTAETLKKLAGFFPTAEGLIAAYLKKFPKLLMLLGCASNYYLENTNSSTNLAYDKNTLTLTTDAWEIIPTIPVTNEKIGIAVKDNPKDLSAESPSLLLALGHLASSLDCTTNINSLVQIIPIELGKLLIQNFPDLSSEEVLLMGLLYLMKNCCSVDANTATLNIYEQRPVSLETIFDVIVEVGPKTIKKLSLFNHDIYTYPATVFQEAR